MPTDRSVPREITILSIAFALIFMGAGAHQQFLAPLFAQTTDWSAVARGFVPATIYLSMTLWRIPSLWIVSRMGERPAMLLGGATYVAFPIVVWYSATYWVLIAAAAIWGVGATLMWVTSSIRIIDAASRRTTGTASGIFNGAAPAGTVIGLVAMASLAASTSLRASFLLAAAFCAAGWVVMARLPHLESRRTRPTVAAAIAMTHRPNWRLVAALLGLSSMGYGLMLVPLGEAIVKNLGVGSLALAGGYSVARMIVSFAGGWLSDMLGRRTVIAGSFLLAGAGLMLTASATESPWALAIGIFSIGLLSGAAPTMGLAFIGDTIGVEDRLMAHSTLFTFHDLGVATAILGGQYLRTVLGGFAPTFATFAVILVCCGIWSLWSFRPAEESAAATA